MTFEKIRSFALSLPGAADDITWENHWRQNVFGDQFYSKKTSIPGSSSFA